VSGARGAMSNALRRALSAGPGGLALFSLALLAGGFLFFSLAIRPLEARIALLEGQLALGARRPGADSTRSGTPEAKLAAFYAHFERQESQVDWLAKLYGTARASGLELRAAEYRLVDTGGRIARYEATLPLSGTYAQVRGFLDRALDENPVLSLDQLALRRKRLGEPFLDAEVALTIHLLAP